MDDASATATGMPAGLIVEMTVTSDLLAGAGHLSDILQRLAQRAQEITGADYAAISTFSEDGTLERFIFTGMTDEQARLLGHPPVGRGLLGELARRDLPLRLDDLQKYASFTGWPEGHPDMTAFLGIPIRALGRTIGSLYMTRVRGRASFGEAEELAGTMMALQAAVSVSVALANERKNRVSLLEERERIAHDLHDGTIQALYALGLEVDSVASQPGIASEGSGVLRECVGRINNLIGDIRTYISALEAESPETAPDLARDLAFVMHRMVPEGVATVLNINAATLPALRPREVEDLIYIAREALSNALRHGDPRKVAVDLRVDADCVALTVQDDGTGYDPALVRRGLGSITMRTRAERLGAELAVLSIPGMGTTVRVILPREHDD